jgi:ParB family chromosome partitioning protein
MKNRALGRGLDALLGESIAATQIEGGVGAIMEISIDFLQPNQYQPRKQFDEKALYELSDSIKRSGIIQPIVVQEIGPERYGIIAGERRFRASKLAGLLTVPVVVKRVTPETLLEMAIVENIQREDLSILEEAEGYLNLMNGFGYTQEELSGMLGKSRSHIANILRVNSLPDSVKELLSKRQLSLGHVKGLVGHENAEEMAGIIVARGLNTRQTEHMVRNWGKNSEGPVTSRSVDNSGGDLDDLVAALSQKFGMKIAIENTGAGGKVTFYFANLEQLDSILTRLN